MGTFELASFQTISEMRKKTIKSKDDLKIGHIIDVVFDDELNLHSFILGGSRWEEFREALGIIDDIDPIVPIEYIQSVGDKEILLNAAKA